MNFEEFKLRAPLFENLNKIGYLKATAIQEAVSPLIMDAKDVSGLAQTGTGKTAAFLLPLMERVLCSRMVAAGLPEDMPAEERELIQKRAFPEWKKHQFVIVLVPTRELAEQVYQDVYKLRGETDLEAVSIYGGTSYDTQKSKLEKGVEFVVGTPGRIIDLFKSNSLDLRQARAVVFDEADRMFDMGFRDDMKFVLQRLPKDRQFLVFSATLNFEVLHTAYQFGADPIEFNVSKDQPKAENVKDFMFHVGQDEKPGFLLTTLKKYNPKQTIVFTNYKYNVDRIAGFLNVNGYPAVAISSLLTQSQRNRVIEQFKSENEMNIMVATDLAARGLDIKGVDLVINFDLPEDAENYVHRIGRTGRAGATGNAVSFVSDRDVESLMRVEEYLKNKVETLWFEESEIVRDFKAGPEERNDRRPRPASDRGPRGASRGGGGDRGRRPQGRDGGGRDSGRPGGDARRGRSADGPNRGPHRDQQRGPHNGPSNATGAPRGERPAGAHSGERHRDRRMGRHPGADGASAAAGESQARSPQQGQGQPRQGQNTARPAGPQARRSGGHGSGNGATSSAKNNGRPQRRYEGPRKDQKSASGAAGKATGKPKTVVSKIKSLFKRLTGG